LLAGRQGPALAVAGALATHLSGGVGRKIGALAQVLMKAQDRRDILVDAGRLEAFLQPIDIAGKVIRRRLTHS